MSDPIYRFRLSEFMHPLFQSEYARNIAIAITAIVSSFCSKSPVSKTIIDPTTIISTNADMYTTMKSVGRSNPSRIELSQFFNFEIFISETPG